MELVQIFVLIALLISGGFAVAFVWATLTGQYDDLDTPAHRILLEDSECSNDDNDSTVVPMGRDEGRRTNEHHYL